MSNTRIACIGAALGLCLLIISNLDAWPGATIALLPMLAGAVIAVALFGK